MNNIDNKRMNLLNEARKSFRHDYKKAVSLCDEAINMAQKIQNREAILECIENYSFIASYSNNENDFFNRVGELLHYSSEWNNYVYQEKAYTMIGAYYWNNSNYEKALENFHKSEKLLVKVKSPAAYALNRRNFGITYGKLEDNKKAIKNLRIASRWAKKSGDAKMTASVDFWLAFHLEHEGFYRQALKYLYKALELFEKVNDSYGIGITLNSIGLLYRDVAAFRSSNTFQDTMGYFEKAMIYAEECRENRLIADVYNNMGLLYLRNQEWEQALKCYKLSISHRKISPFKENEAITLQNIGNVYVRMGNNDKAYEYYLEALNIRRELGNVYYLISSLCNILNFLLENDNLADAGKFYQELCELESKTTNNRSLMEIYHHLSIYCERQNDYQQALYYYKKSREIQDIVYNGDLETRLKTINDKHQLKIAKLLSANKIAQEKAKAAKAMACTACHQLSQPLSILQGYFELMLDSNKDIFVYNKCNQQYILNMQNAFEDINRKLRSLTNSSDISYGTYIDDVEMVIFNKEGLANGK